MSTPEEKKEQEILEQEREVKKQIVVQTILAQCKADSEFEDLRTIHKAVHQEGGGGDDELIAMNLTGGKTNFSYKIHLKNQPQVALFAKICFAYALWNPDRSVHYDLKRTENEFQVMKDFQKMMGEKAPVAQPYFCVDVEQGESKVLVTQWAKTDEQWANQFIDGKVDRRVIPKLAVAFATLSCAPVEKEFNNNVRSCFRTMYPLSKMIFGQLIATDTDRDDCVAYCKRLGQEAFDQMIDGMEVEYDKKEELSHSDSACFNILVEKKPSIETLQDFGPTGDVVLCDWEMAYCGPSGRDVGILMGWPLACAFAHAVQGRVSEANHIVDCMKEVWDVYHATMIEKGSKSQDYLCKAFRNALGWTSLYLVIAYYMLGLDVHELPLEGATEGDTTKAKGAIGLVGLKLLQYSFGGIKPDLSLEELRAEFHGLLTDKFASLSEGKVGVLGRPRRMSLLRAQDRRISDAGAMEEAARRLSEQIIIDHGAIYD